MDYALKMTFLGSGSAFTVNDDNYQSNILLESAAGRRLLLDCGTDARFSLNEQGYSYRDIDDVYISHLHSDHIGGLEWLGLSTIFDPSCKPIRLFISSALRKDLWSHALKGGMGTLEYQHATLGHFFDLSEVGRNGNFTWENITFSLVQTVHVVNAYEFMPCFGLLFKVAEKMIFFTADTQYAPQQLHDVYKAADIIFHDCETAERKTKVHAHYTELLQIDPELRKKIWLYHFNPHNPYDARQDGFQGFVKKGQIFYF